MEVEQKEKFVEENKEQGREEGRWMKEHQMKATIWGADGYWRGNRGEIRREDQHAHEVCLGFKESEQLQQVDDTLDDHSRLPCINHETSQHDRS